MADTVVTVILRARDEASGAVNNLAAGFKRLEAQGGPLSSTFGGVATAIEAIGPAGLAAAAGVAAVGIAATAAANAFVDTVKQGADIGDALNKTAEQTGLTVEELSRLKFAADQNESSLEAVSSAIKFMSKNLFEAQQGGKEQIETLRALGFTGIEAAGNLGTTSEALVKVADKLKAIPDQGTRVALAMKLMGRGALESLPLFQQGGAVLEEYGRKADAMRATVSTAAGVLGDEFNDSLGALRAQFDALKTKIAENALPAFITVLESASGAVAQLAQTIEANKDSIKLFADTLAGLANITIRISVLGLDAVKGAMDVLAPFKEVAEAAERSRNQDLKKQQVIATGKKDAQGRDIFSQEVPLIEGPEVTTAARPKKAIHELTDAEKKAIETTQELREELKATLSASFSVPDSAVETIEGLGVDLKSQISALKDIQAALNSFDQPELIRATGPDGKGVTDVQAMGAASKKSLDDAADSLGGSDKLDEIKPELTVSNAAAIELLKTFEQFGIPIDGLLEKLAVIGPELTEVQALGVGLGEGLREALGQAFDPLQVGLDGVGQAVGNLRQGFDQAFESLGQHILAGTTGMIRFADVLRNAALAASKFAIELGLAIVKALILKAITGGLFSSGGAVSASSGGFGIPGGPVGLPPRALATGGPVSFERAPGFSSGGPVGFMRRIAGYASGGPIQNLAGALTAAAIFASPLHASTGMALAGGPSYTDTIPIMASAGEFVVANHGASTGTSITAGLVRGLDTVREIVQRVGAAPAQAAAASAPVIGTVVVQALDGASVRHQVRPGGEIERQVARSAELGRWGPW